MPKLRPAGTKIIHELEKLFVSLYAPPKSSVEPFRPTAVYPPAVISKLSIYSIAIGRGRIVLFVKSPVVTLYKRPVELMLCCTSGLTHLTTVVSVGVGTIFCGVPSLYAICDTFPTGPVGPVLPNEEP